MLIRIVGGWSAFTVMTGLVRNWPSPLLNRTVFGAAEAGAFPTLSRALSRWFPINERSRANGIMWMGARSGGAFAPPVAVALMAWSDGDDFRHFRSRGTGVVPVFAVGIAMIRRNIRR